MRDETLFQSYKCKCANGRLERSIHWHFIHLTSAAWEVQMLHHVNTFRKKYSFHSGNVKPGCTRNIQNIHILSVLLHWTSENFHVHFRVHIHSIPFPMQMAHGVAADSPAHLKPPHACLTPAIRQISQLPPTSSLRAFPAWSWKAPASVLVSQHDLRTSKAAALPCHTTPVNMRLLLHLDKSTGTQQRCNRVGRWRGLAGKARPSAALWCCKGIQIS